MLIKYDYFDNIYTLHRKVSKYRVVSGPYFPVFGLNTEIYGVNLHIQSEYRRIRTRNNSVFRFRHLSLSDRVITFTLLVTLETVQMLGKKSCLILRATLLKTELFRRYFSRINVNFSEATILSNTSEWLPLYLSFLLPGHILVKA